VDLWLAGAAIVALGAGGGALGAWWQRRHPDSEPFKPPALALPVSRESLGLAAAWMFAGYVAAAVAVGGVVMLTGSVLHAIDLVTAGPGGILLAAMLLLPLLIFAFISGQQMCRHHGLSVDQAALAILLGMAAITVVFGVSDRPDVLGTKTAEPERLPHHIALVAIVWALTVAVGVLGARSASPAPKCDQVLEAARTKAQAGAGAGLSNDRD
jgi:hypothetical protein